MSSHNNRSHLPTTLHYIEIYKNMVLKSHMAWHSDFSLFMAVTLPLHYIEIYKNMVLKSHMAWHSDFSLFMAVTLLLIRLHQALLHSWVERTHGRRCVTTAEGQAFAKKHGLLFMEMSARNAAEVEQAFIGTAEQVGHMASMIYTVLFDVCCCECARRSSPVVTEPLTLVMTRRSS